LVKQPEKPGYLPGFRDFLPEIVQIFQRKIILPGGAVSAPGLWYNGEKRRKG
jgi:hypothetical protein